MSRALHAYLDPAQVPDLPSLQTSIKRLGFKLTLDEAYAPFKTNGYLPCTVEGEDAGVDLRFERDAAAASLSPPADLGARTAAMRLRWSGDAREQLSALVIAAALAQDFDALIVEPDAGQLQTGAALIKQARQLVEDSF